MTIDRIWVSHKEGIGGRSSVKKSGILSKNTGGFISLPANDQAGELDAFLTNRMKANVKPDGTVKRPGRPRLF